MRKFRIPRPNTQKGFTIVELLLALAVFSFVLVFVTTTFVQLFRTYSRGVTRKITSQEGYALVEDIAVRTQAVAEPTLVNAAFTGQGRLCVGDYSYVWNTIGQATNLIRVNGQQVNMARIDGDTGQTACKAPLPNDFTGVQAVNLLSTKTGMQSLTLTPSAGGISGLYTINVAVSSSSQTFLDQLLKTCRTDSLSSAYCAKVDIQQTIGSRLR